MVLNNGARQLI